MRGWWPSSPMEAVKSSIETPAFTPIGGIFKGTTTALKVGTGIVGGFVLSSLLGGGGTQTIQPVQQPTVTPTQDLRQRFEARTTQAIRDLFQRAAGKVDAGADVKVDVAPDIIPTYNVQDVGGDVSIGGITHITPTDVGVSAQLDQALVGQLSSILQSGRQAPTQITITPSQQITEAKQEGGGSSLLVIAGLVIIAAIVLFKGKKK